MHALLQILNNTSQRRLEYRPPQSQQSQQNGSASNAKAEDSLQGGSAQVATVRESGLIGRIDRENFVREYVESLVSETKRSYSTSLRDFAKFAECRSVKQAVEELIQAGRIGANMCVTMYRKNLIERGLSSSTVNVRMAAVKGVISFARKLGLIDWKVEVKKIKAQQYRETGGPGVEAFLKAMKNAEINSEDKYRSCRDRAILGLLYGCALRRGELSNLNLCDIDFDDKRIRIKGKGRQDSEWFPMPEPVADLLTKWIEQRGAWPGPLFVRLTAGSSDAEPQRLSGDGVRVVVMTMGEKIGVRMRPHGLRHTAITEGLNQTGGDLASVAAFSRHKSLDVLKIYDDNRKERARNVADVIGMTMDFMDPEDEDDLV